MRKNGKLAAIKAAKSSTCSERMGAALLSGNKVIATSPNKDKSHPLQKYLNNKYLSFRSRDHLHAEIAVITSCNSDIKGLDLYVVRLLFDDSLAIAKPCPACWAAIKKAGIRRVYWYEYKCWKRQLVDEPVEFHKRYTKNSTVASSL